jgi:hypothetical protein
MRHRRRNAISGQFSAHLIEMQKSPAYQILSRSARRVLERIEIEHADHGGAENGRLVVTKQDFVAFGIHHKALTPALREIEFLGFIEVTQRGRGGNAEFRQPNRFRLTYQHAKDVPGDGTHEWRRIKTREEAIEIVAEARGPSREREAARRARQKQKSGDGSRHVSGTVSTPENGKVPGTVSVPTARGRKPSLLSISGAGAGDPDEGRNAPTVDPVASTPSDFSRPAPASALSASEAKPASATDRWRWMSTLQSWSAAPDQVHAAQVNRLIAAAGPDRVAWLDELFGHLDAQWRVPGTQKIEWIDKYADRMRRHPRYWPQLRQLRESPDVDAIIALLREAPGQRLDKAQLAREIPKIRKITDAALTTMLGLLVRGGKIDRVADGVYTLPGSTAAPYIRPSQLIVRELIAAPHYLMTRAELQAMIGGTETTTNKAIWTLRRGGVLAASERGLRGWVALTPESLAKIQRGEVIRDGRGGVLWAPDARPAVETA